MENNYLLGIDIGTSSCKVSVYNKAGMMLFHTSSAYSTSYPNNNFAEQSPLDWWIAVKVCLNRLFEANEQTMKRIIAVGVAGQSGALVLLNKERQVISPAMIWLDGRSQQECEKWMNSPHYEHIYSSTQNPMSPSYLTSKISWLQKHQPHVINEVDTLLQSNGYIVYQLTGQLSHDVSQANGLHCFNIAERRWDPDLASILTINLEWLPPLVESAQVVGTVSSQVALETHLPVGIPVVAGGLDAACAALGIGVINEGEVQEQGGQAGGMSIVVNKAVGHPKLILSPHVVGDSYLLQGGTVGGGSLNWFKREFFADQVDEEFYIALKKQAEQIKAGSDNIIYLPYMAGERSPIWDNRAKGMFIGLNYEKTKAHLLRAILEGCAYALKHNLEIAEQTGIAISTLYSVGGAANSQLWMQIKADVTEKNVQVAESSETTTLGAAMLAALGAGVFENVAEAKASMVRLKPETITPNPNHVNTYQQLYSLYKQIYPIMKPITDKLGGDQ